MGEPILTREFLVTPELCGQDGRLTALGALTLFQSLASEHAEQIGVGFAAMAAREEFWLTVHCRVELLRSVALMENLTGQTWPEACRAQDIRSFRSYRLQRGDETVALGRTQWAIAGKDGGIVRMGQSGFPADFTYHQESAIPEKPRRFRDDFAEGTGIFYRVRSTDIDVGRHMNNVAYIRALLGCCTAEEVTKIRSIEAHYASPCLEGEALTLHRKEDGAELRLAVKKEDGKAAVLAGIGFWDEYIYKKYI